MCQCPGPRQKTALAETPKVEAEVVSLGQQYMLRREEFGGLLFNKQTFSAFSCNHSAFSILRFIEDAEGLSMSTLARIGSHLREYFGGVPDCVEDIILAFVNGCLKEGFLRVGK
jgi:hypothetical protein